MGRNFTSEAIAQLAYARGEVLRGDAGLVLLKGLLQSGVAYLGGYPGAPTSTLYDAITDAYQPVSECNPDVWTRLVVGFNQLVARALFGVPA